MLITVIGANSYIARNFIYWLKKNYQLDFDLYDNAEEHLDRESPYKKLDIFDQEKVATAIEHSDLIYFFVGKTGTLQGFDEPSTFLNVNENSLLTLLNACKDHNRHAKIIFPSTRLVYRGDSIPLVETAEKQFLTPYAIQKYACEQYLEMYHRLWNINYVTLRICVPYGSMVPPTRSYGTLDFFVNQAKSNGKIAIFGDGLQRRTFIHIADLCEVLYKTGLSRDVQNDVYNVGGEEYSIREIAEIIADKYQASIIFKDWPRDSKIIESGDTVFNATKLETLLNYKPFRTFKDWLED